MHENANKGCKSCKKVYTRKAMLRKTFKQSLKAALPIMVGYVPLGIPCGILCNAAGMDLWMIFAMSVLFYSGAGQYMIPNMYMAGNPLTAIILSVSLVNGRQMLYGASLSQFCGKVSKRLAFIFGATVTDESFGVNLAKFINEGEKWTVKNAFFVNVCSQTSWIVSNVVGALVGSAIAVPTVLASFAMTALFICLLCMQKITSANLVAAGGAMVGVIACKLIGASGPAILVGALLGVILATGFSSSGESKKDSSSIRVGD